MRQRSIGTSLVGGAAVTLLLAALSGCALGVLLSKPWIRNANNNRVVFFGDSIFALSGEIQKILYGNAGGTFRNYTTSGAELVGGAIAPSVEQQIATANADNPNSTVVVMNGGGNDILIPAVALDPYNCLTQWYEFGRLSASCKSFIDDIYVDGVDLLNGLAADGVTDVVYLGYYYTKNGLLLRGRSRGGRRLRRREAGAGLPELRGPLHVPGSAHDHQGQRHHGRRRAPERLGLEASWPI